MNSVNGAVSSEKFLINCRYNPTKPKNDLTCFLVVGRSACSIELILSWQGCNVPSLTMCPKYSILANPMKHFTDFTVRFASLCNSARSVSICCYHVRVKMIISSTKLSTFDKF